MILLNSSFLFSQVGINTDSTTPHGSAMLHVKSTNKGFLPPQNLNLGTMIPGSSNQTNHIAIEKYCIDNDEAIVQYMVAYTSGIMPCNGQQLRGCREYAQQDGICRLTMTGLH